MAKEHPTGPPAFYDKHFGKQYQLLRMRRLPGLSSALEGHVDDRLERQKASQKDVAVISGTSFIKRIMRGPPDVASEGQISSIMQSLGQGCAAWAEVLMLAPVLPLPSDWWRILGVLCGETSATQHLRVHPLATWPPDAVEQLPLRTRQAVQRMEAEEKTVLTTTEFTLPAAAGAFEEIYDMALESRCLPWTTCAGTGCNDCGLIHHFGTAEPSLARDHYQEHPFPPREAAPTDIQNAAVTQTLDTTYDEMLERQGTTRAELEQSMMACQKGEVVGSLKRKAITWDDYPYQTGLQMVLEAYAQAVRDDVTFFTIGAGANAEYIYLRHRASQTLWISDLIVPHKHPRYGKLQIGLYIAVGKSRSRDGSQT